MLWTIYVSNRIAIDRSYNWHIHVEDRVTFNGVCSEQLVTSRKRGTIVSCNKSV